MAWKRAHNRAEGEPITSTATVWHDLGKRRSAQRFPVVPWRGWGRRFDSGGGLHIGPDQRKRWSVPHLGCRLTGRRWSAWRSVGAGQAHAGPRALPWLPVRVLDEPVPSPVRLRHTRCDEGPVLTWPLECSVGRPGQARRKAGTAGTRRCWSADSGGGASGRLGGVGFDGAFGDQWPGGEGPVGPALGDQPKGHRPRARPGGGA